MHAIRSMALGRGGVPWRSLKACFGVMLTSRPMGGHGSLAPEWADTDGFYGAFFEALLPAVLGESFAIVSRIGRYDGALRGASVPASQPDRTATSTAHVGRVRLSAASCVLTRCNRIRRYRETRTLTEV